MTRQRERIYYDGMPIPALPTPCPYHPQGHIDLTMYDLADAARILGLRVSTVIEYCRQGKLPGRRQPSARNQKAYKWCFLGYELADALLGRTATDADLLKEDNELTSTQRNIKKAWRQRHTNIKNLRKNVVHEKS